MNNQPGEKKQGIKRPDILMVLCILSFIGSGMSAFSNLFFYISYDQLEQLMPEIEQMLKDMNFEGNEFEFILSGGKRFFLAGFILYMISLAGVMRMWRLRKLGFHLYTAAQLFILILPMITLADYGFNVFAWMLTGAFILGYGSQLKVMN